MQNIEYIFNPRSIAVVGVSESNFAKLAFLDPLIEFKYKGEIYPINPKVKEISGLKAYASILDVPGPVDHVICCIKASLTPQLMRECVIKGVKSIHLFTSGFSETGEEKGIRLEREIVDIAREGGVRIIGPNCMGIYCPRSGISFDNSFPKEEGDVAFLSQSGGNSVELVQLGSVRDLRFSKVISFGNASDLNECDFIEYLAHDPQTNIILIYLEGTKDGKRLINALKEAAKRKFIIILKGGVSDAGRRAVASHTGALAGDRSIWNAFFDQLGIVQAQDLEELVDMALAFKHLKSPKGKRVGIIGVGGGFGVLATDNCENEGLSVPSLPDKMKKKLREIVPEEVDPGTSVRNPVDLSTSGWNLDIFSRALKTLADYEGIDFLFVYTTVAFGLYRGTNVMVDMLIDTIIEEKKSIDKPLVVVVRSSGDPEVAPFVHDVQERLLKAGIPVYPSTIRAARVMSRFIWSFLKRR
ncbi:MAG: hypothetical protein EF806_04080 [Candidatus Methanoliparum thermophilum]|uniref:acetate--CoA ligase (ADP-forming) n=1 Tax=Methanoliparum thermophilum TaxID=2491083 RepID=A0A520KRV6_METT2|nr:CoA-binding protein [Candidatus Methanoliparum sp. LAM-1]RZN64526.1 MAG: hypothetical protein EF806_04080 [Candidatus Methanoliparum thermophilum]BDC35877.1 Acetyl-CoA ligase/synthetase I (AMP-forming) subunit A [Candidatus Methanoliparum sp. LAM-1]